MILFAANGGVAWRNSDPTICARSYRATRECNVPFKRIGDVAPDFKGFSMHGWANRSTLPGLCAYAEIDGVESKNLVICTPPADTVKEYRKAVPPKPLQTLCRDLFGIGVAMNAPIGALADVSDAKTDTPFCKALVEGARKAQAPAREVAP